MIKAQKWKISRGRKMQQSNGAEGEETEANSLKLCSLWNGLWKIWRDVLICNTVAPCDRQTR